MSIRSCVFVGLCALVFAAARLEAGEKPAPEKKSFTIGKETTRITAPLDKDGYPDYAMALNDRLSEGVTKDNNAVALLCKVFGPKPEGALLVPEFYKRLGIEASPEEGQYLVDFVKFAEVKEKLEPEARERLYSLLDELGKRPWKTSEFPKVAEWLKAMEEPLKLAAEATRRPKYYHPLIVARTERGPDSLITCLIPMVQRCRQLGQTFTIRAMLNLGEGRTDEAWQDLLACHRLARQISHGGTMIENLVGIALEHIAGDTDLTLLERGKLDEKKLRRIWKDWRELPAFKSVAANLDAGERFMVLESVLLVDRYGLDFMEWMGGGKRKKREPARLKGVNWDPALKNINSFFDRVAVVLAEKDHAKRQGALTKLEMELRGLKAKIGDRLPLDLAIYVFLTPEQRGERIGNVLITLLVPAFTKVQMAEERTTQLLANMDAAFALEAFRIDNGKFPKELSELVPKYLKQAPVDLFTGKGPVYRPVADGYLLYSFGPNGKDDEARSRDDDPPGDDLVIRIPRPARKK